MLQSIRDRAQGWLAGVIVFLICIPFALWGINEYFGGAASAVVAEVNGKEIGLGQYQQAYQNYRQQLRRLFGESIDIEKLNQERLKLDALNQLVDSEALKQEALDSGMRISDAQLASAIQSFPAFQVEESFSRERYEQTLQLMGMSPTGFEAQLRRDLINEQLRKGVEDSAFVTVRERRIADRLQYQRRTVRYLYLSAADAADAIDVSEKEVAAYYEQHLAEFTTPEMVKIEYLELTLDDLAGEVGLKDGQVETEYEARLESYRTPEERVAHHILVAVDKAATESEEAAAQAKAEQLLEKIKGGEDFETLAREQSDDLASRADGGATGAVRRGQMAPKFEEAIFSLQPGEIRLVRSQFGFHVVRLDEVIAARTRSLEEVRDELETTLRREKAENLLYEQVDRLANMAYENPATLAVAADTLGLTIASAGPFSRRGADSALDQSFLDALDTDAARSAAAEQDITKNAKIIEAAFSSAVLNEGHNSDLIELSPVRFAVLRVAEHLAATPRALEEVREPVTDAIKLARAAEQVRARGENILAELRSGAEPEAVAASHAGSWQRVENADRNSAELNRSVLRHAFQMPRPEGEQMTYDGLSLGSGDYVVVALESVNEEVPEDLADEERKRTNEQLTRNVQLWEWLDFVADVKQSTEIEVFTDSL